MASLRISAPIVSVFASTESERHRVRGSYLEEISFMPKLRVAFCILSAAAFALGFGQRPAIAQADAEPPAMPDILLVTFDTLRADHTSLAGYARQTTPGLVELASGGVQFTQAYAPSATTLPSHATLFTGLSPPAHGVLANSYTLAAEHTTLAETLRARGYRSGAFVSSTILARRQGLDQGFDTFDGGGLELLPADEAIDGPAGPIALASVGRRADATVDLALAWFRDNRSHPVFLWVHLFDPHEPYFPPLSAGDPFGATESDQHRPIEVAKRLYDTEIAFADQQMWRLVESLEVAGGERGLLSIVTADHGEEFLEHGWRGHGVHLYEESIRVPLVIRWLRSVPSGLRLSNPVSLQDVVPILHSLIGVPSRAPGPKAPRLGIDRSTWSDWSHEDRPIFSIRRAYRRDGLVKAIPLEELDGTAFGIDIPTAGQQYGVRRGRWKYLEAIEQNTPRELYDLDIDPHETRNVAEAHPVVVGDLSSLIADWLARDRRDVQAPSLSDAQLRQLDALGYAEPVSEKPEAEPLD